MTTSRKLNEVGRAARAALVALCLAASGAGCAEWQGKEALPVPSVEYAIGQDDVLDITVWKDEALSRTVPVRRDGKITLPLVGELQAEGRTPSELAKEIKGRLTSLVKEPAVQVIVRESNSSRFFVVGEVSRPGVYKLQGKLTPVQAIAVAGGLTEFAKRGRIMVIRRTQAGESRVSVDFDDLVKGRGQLHTLAPGDTVYVP